jgi:O-antigen/teichoic acid export membrane protein
MAQETGAAFLRARAISAARWTAIWMVANKVMHAATTIVLARALSHGEFGAIALLTLVSTATSLCQDFGTSAGLIYRQEEEQQTAGFVLAFQLAVGLGLMALMLAGADLFARFFANPVLAPALRVLAIAHLVLPFVSVPVARLERALDYRGRTIVDLSGGTMNAVVVVVLAATGFGVWAFVWATLAGRATAAAVAALGYRRPVSFAFTRRLVRETLAYSRYVYGETVLWYASVNVDDVLVGRLLGTPALGIYKLAFSTAVMPANAVGALTRVAFPAFARIRDDRVLLAHAFLRATEYCVMIGVPVFAVLGLLAEPLVDLVYGERWLAAAPVLMLLAPYGVLWLAATMLGDVIKASGAVRALFWINAGRAILLLGCLLWAVHWGVIGVAVAVLVVAGLTRVVQFVVVARTLHIPAAGFRAAFAPTVLAGGAMTAVVVVVRSSLPPLPPVLDIVLHAVLGVATYVLALVAVSRARVVELFDLIRAAAMAQQR